MPDSIVTPLEALRKFLLAERERAVNTKAGFAIGGNAWFLAEGERQAHQAAIDELKRLEAANFADFHQAFEAAHPGKAAEIRAAFEGEREALALDDPLAAGVRSLVAGLDAIRARASAPEARDPSGEPWRPAVGEECLYYFGQSWLRARRIADQGNPEDDSDQEAFPQRFETIDAKTGCGYLYCDATYDGVRPLGSLPVPPSCGGEPEASPEEASPAVASERTGLTWLLEWADTMLGNEREAPREYPEGREDAFADFVHEIQREIAAIAPRSIAEDLRTPEPGAFDGAVVVGGDDQLEREIEALAREVTREDRNLAVREALAELRGELVRPRSPSDPLFTGLAGLSMAANLIDRFAERFKP